MMADITAEKYGPLDPEEPSFEIKGRNRANSMASGTANIIKSWPDHLTIYTLALSVVLLTIIILLNLSFYFMTPTIDENATLRKVQLDCRKHNNIDSMMMTRKYTQPDAYLFAIINKEDEEQSMHNIKNNLVGKTRIYEDFHLSTLFLKNDTEEFISSWKYRMQEHKDFTLSQFFENSPFEKSWHNMNYNVVPFAVMVASLWEHGGLFIDLEKVSRNAMANDSDNAMKSLNDDILVNDLDTITHFKGAKINNIQDVINYEVGSVNKTVIKKKKRSISDAETKVSFLKFPNNEEVMIDRSGLFVSVRVPCHAFLGQLIQQLHSKKSYRAAAEVIGDALAKFCKKSNCKDVVVF